MGSVESFEYNDVIGNIQSVDESVEIWQTLFAHLRQLGVEKILWQYIPTDSIAYKGLEVLKSSGDISFEAPWNTNNVKIDFNGKTYNEYFRSLSKHVRQNCRTAYNRLSKDGHIYSFGIHYGDTLCEAKAMKNKYDSIYLLRQKSHYGDSILLLAFRKFFHYTPKTVFSDEGFCAELTINGEFAAIMQGYCYASAHSVDIKRVAINDKYKQYSPGLCMLNEAVRYLIDHSDVRTIDLGRGDEKYKLDMGGQTYHTAVFQIVLNKKA